MKDKKTLRWLWLVPGRKKGCIAAMTAAQMAAGTVGVLYALLLRGIVNGAVAGDAASFWHYAMLILLLTAGQLALQAVIRWLNEWSRAMLENAFKQRLTEQILRRDYAAVSAIHSGEWLNRLTNDTVVVAGGYVEILPGLAGMTVRLISALAALIALDSTFALVLLPAGAALVGLTYLFRRVLKRLHRRMQESDGTLRVFLQERIGSLMLIKSFAAEKRTAEEAETRMEEHKAARMRKNRFSNFCNVGFGAAMSGMYLFGVMYCAYGILTGAVSYGTLTAVMQLIGQVQAPFANISGYLPRWYAMTASAERLMEIEDYQPDGGEEALPLSEIQKEYRDGLASLGLRNACFSYPGDDIPVLQNLSLDIRKGEYVAFTGPSGCGKSTVLKLLLAMYGLQGGEAYIRNIGGEERPLTAEWRRLFAYVPQGTALMSGTIRKTVALADPTQAGDEERLRQSLRAACAEEFVAELENGLDTPLGERGAGLSEGQLQRLSIARALFADRPVLLLDEATSALDEETEKQLLLNLRSLTDKTVLIVTHRPAALSVCDRRIHFSQAGVSERR